MHKHVCIFYIHVDRQTNMDTHNIYAHTYMYTYLCKYAPTPPHPSAKQQQDKGHFPEKNTVCQGIFKFVW